MNNRAFWITLLLFIFLEFSALKTDPGLNLDSGNMRYEKRTIARVTSETYCEIPKSSYSQLLRQSSGRGLRPRRLSLPTPSLVVDSPSTDEYYSRTLCRDSTASYLVPVEYVEMPDQSEHVGININALAPGKRRQPLTLYDNWHLNDVYNGSLGNFVLFLRDLPVGDNLLVRKMNSWSYSFKFQLKSYYVNNLHPASIAFLLHSRFTIVI